MSDILTGFNMQGNDPIDDRIVSKSSLETLEQYLNRVPVQKRYYGLTFFALDKNNELRKYTFQTSLIEPTIDDDEEEIERIDKELQEHVSNKAIHKTSEEIRSEIVDADIPDTIARVQWTLDQINTAVINLIGGASDEYNTLKRIQTKIEELRAKIYGDDGSTVLNTLEQALKFLNQYKDFIVDIPENFVNKQDIVDNLTTDDPTKVLSAKQGKVLSDTLTNYFESAMQSIRTETDRAINAENRIEAKLDKEIERSTNEDIRIDNKLDSEINRSTAEDDRLDKKIDAETTRATTAESNLNTKIETETDRAEGEESRIETKLDNEITRSTNKDTEHDNRLQALEGQTHEQNTDLGTTNSTFQLKYNTGNKIKHESDAISVRNAADTDYVNFIAKNATFKGDLLVEGQSFVTEAETVEIKDNLLLLNKGEVGAGVTKGIAGLEIDRGTEPNYQIIFDESDNRFKAGEIGDIQCLALRDGDDSMTGGMFTSWDSTTKRLKTTNIIPSDQKILFGDNGDIELKYSLSKMGEVLPVTAPVLNIGRKGSNYPHIEFGLPSTHAVVYTDAPNGIYLQNQVLGRTFKRASDNSEVLYHADIINDLTTGGTNKVLSAEQGKLLQNSITSIQGSYLPLSGGTMTGSIRFPVGLGIVCEDVSGSAAYGVLRTWNYNGSTRMYVGTVNFPTYISSTASDLIHDRNGSSYLLWDSYNLLDPAKLSANQTFTGLNTFTEKIAVGSLTSSQILLDPSQEVVYRYASTEVSRGYSISLGALNNIRKFTYGGYYSASKNDEYAYLSLPTQSWDTSSYKFYAVKLAIPKVWSLTDKTDDVITLTNSSTTFGRESTPLRLRGDNTDLIYYRGNNTYKIWDEFNLSDPATSTDLTNYLPLTGGTLTGQVTIKQGVDIKLRLQSTDADNHCIIQAINAQASQLGVFGYSKDKWAIGHGGTYYEIWDKYNLTNPVRYTLDTSGYPNFQDVNGNNFSYIKAGPSGILPNVAGTLSSGGNGYVGTNRWSFRTGYINNLHTNKITFGETGPYIIGSTSATQFLNAEGSAQKVATGGLYVGSSYASDALNLVPANGIYSQGNIKTSGWLTFEDNEWTNTGWAYKEAKGSIKVLSVINETENRPTTNGSVFQFNSRQGHWCTQIWCDQTNVAGVIGTLRFRTTKSFNSTEWNPWTALVTPSDLGNYLPLTGGILTGSSPRVLGIDFSGENETYIRVLRNGKQQAAIGFMDDLGAYIYNYNSSKYLFIDNDGYARVGTTNGSTKLALITDIPTVSGYLPLSGGTMSGNISFNGDTGHIVVGARETSNFVSAISFSKGSATNSAYIGYHSTGGLDSSGALVLVPYPTSVNPWDKTVGLYIAKNELLLDGKAIATTDQIPSIPSISISNSGTGNAVTSITANGHTLNVTKGATYLTSSALSGYATQSWANGQFASLALYSVTNGYAAIKTRGNEICIGSLTSGNSVINVNYRNGTGTTSPSTWYWRAGSPTTWADAYWGNLYMNDNLVATQSWVSEQFPTKTGIGASGTWDINISGNASTASAASKLGSTTIGGSAKPIYLSSGTPTACSATVGSATVPVYMNAGTITQCSTTLGVSITGNAATATNATQLGGTAASSYVKANDNISRLTNDSGYTTQEWVNGQGFLTSDSILDKFVPTTGGYIRNSDQVLLRLQRTGVSIDTRTIEMYFDDSNTDGTSTTPRGSIGYSPEVGMFLYSAKSKKFLAIENTGRPFYGTSDNRYYLLGSNTQYHNSDGYQRIGDIMIQWGFFTVQGNSTKAVNFSISFTNTVWSVTGSWDNTSTGGQENWGFTDYTSSGFTIINGDGSSRVFHYIAIGPFTRS
jgi:hypothetical protein